MRMVGVVLGCAMVAAIIAPNSNYRAAASQAGDKQLLEPGITYVASFGYDERRQACLKLHYIDGTGDFSRCLEGFFPENPWFTN